MIDIQNPHKVAVVRQCSLLGVAKSSAYYCPKPPAMRQNHVEERLVVENATHPVYGSRRLTAVLRRGGVVVNRKRVQRVMREHGLKAIYPKHRTTTSGQFCEKFPYLLKNKVIDRPNQVWASDITYIPMGKGYFYLAVVLDWHSRKVLSWRLSNTMDAGLCVGVLQDALAKYERPDIFNSDQGSQYTSQRFVDVLCAHSVQISRDGQGRYADNIRVERAWRTVKYEHVKLHAFADGHELEQSLAQWFDHYNQNRPHQSLNYRTPNEVYFDPVLQTAA